MSSNPNLVVSAAPISQSPLVDKDGRLTPQWQRWFTSLQRAQVTINNIVNPGGAIIAPLDVSSAISGRGGTLGSILAHLLDSGVFDSTDNVTDGTGSPLAGGKEAYLALVTSGPSAGQVLQWNGTQWVPVTLAAGGVTSVNSQAGAVSLVAGTNITITPGSPSAGDITIAASGGAGLPTNNPTFTGAMTGPHYAGNGSSPGIVVGAAAGTGGTAILTGDSTDAGGQIQIVTGTGPATGTLATVTFSVAYAAQPRVIISPANGAAIMDGTTPTQVSADATTTGFVLDVHPNAMAALVNYAAWNYMVIG